MTGKAPNGRNHLSIWTIKEIQFVEQHYGRLSTEEIARSLGRSIVAVRRIAQMSGVGKSRAKSWTEEERTLIRLHYNKGLDYMQTLLPGRTKLAINSQASRLGVTNSDWTDQERQYLKDNYGIKTASKIAFILGRSLSGVRSMAGEMNVGKKAKTPGKPWTEREMAILRAHCNQNAWIVRVQALLPGRTRAAIGAHASKVGLTVTQSWTPDEINILETFYQEHGSKIADKLPGRTKASIKLQAAKLGIRFRNRQPRQTPILPWSEAELSLLEKHQNASIGELVALFPVRTKYAIEHMRSQVKKKNHND
ncbi:MAG TPA: SANT/Myb-like DNA-binding domain-containing protein [Scandinavium sp.]|jgi:ribosomal protein L32E